MEVSSQPLGLALRLAEDHADSKSRLFFTSAVLYRPFSEVFVVFTDTDGTAAALKAACAWADRLKFQIDLIVPQVVPFPLAPTHPAVPIGFISREIRKLVDSIGVDTNVHIYLCRDRVQTLKEVLPRNAIVLLGCRRKRFSWPVWRLARKLQGCGHTILTVRD